MDKGMHVKIDCKINSAKVGIHNNGHVSSFVYQSLLRARQNSPMRLVSNREQMAEEIAGFKRSLMKQSWKKIQHSKAKNLNQVDFLRENGYLRVDAPWADDLFKGIRKISEKTGSFNCHISKAHLIPRVESIPEIQHVINDKSLYNIISLYLNCPANYYGSLAWWDFPTPKGSNPYQAQCWHRDSEDFKVVKLFVYGESVDESNGPHQYLLGTHRSENYGKLFMPKSASRQQELDTYFNKFMNDTDFAEAYSPSAKLKTWHGDKYTAFIEDATGFHRGKAVTTGKRLIFSSIWTVGVGKQRVSAMTDDESGKPFNLTFGD